MDQAEDALEAAWRFFLREDMDVSFAAVVEFARVGCSSVDPKCIRNEFERRFKRTRESSASVKGSE